MFGKRTAKAGRWVFWLMWPALRLYLPTTSRTRIVIVCADKILVTNTWLSDGRWGLPGGGKRRGETPLNCALREVYEETGIRLEARQLKQLAHETSHNRGLWFDCHYFAVLLVHPPELQLRRFEITGAKWIQKSEPFSVASRTEYAADVRAALMHLMKDDALLQ